ncbi:uncharacterized protein LOC121737453 [Aricia agestis]|uniref:uncharacterized protein LOC121737453 n=1 Tax=Aricia agestis TaxID=91739 RepID=UPI001C2017DC|nr:uncharacterized protein LOC121737453 [Aricia agestis]
MERNLKEQIVKSASAVKRKVEMIKNTKNTNDMALETIFQPIVSPLKLLASKTEKKRHEEDEEESSNRSHEKFEESETDLDDEENSDNDDFSSKTPDKTLTTSPSEDNDIHENSFKSIQSSPSIANDSLSWSVSSEALKEDIPYGPLFKFARNNTSSVESLQRGEGINILKEVKKDTDLVYWNDPNELVERLKILLASRAAGNTGLDNEVNAILEEMKEAEKDDEAVNKEYVDKSVQALKNEMMKIQSNVRNFLHSLEKITTTNFSKIYYTKQEIDNMIAAKSVQNE